MLAMFFFIALYMQNILGYSPLEAGVRFLPSTVVIIVAAPIAGRLTDRIGARIPIAVGLSLVALALYMQSHVDVDTSYSYLLAVVLVDGPRHGPRDVADDDRRDERGRRSTKAGVASGILSMSRMVGGTFGVAAVGALFQQISDNRLETGLGDLPLTAPSSRPGSRTTSAPAPCRASCAQLDPQTAHAGRRRAAGRLRHVALDLAEALRRGGRGRASRSRSLTLRGARPRAAGVAASARRSHCWPDCRRLASAAVCPNPVARR